MEMTENRRRARRPRFPLRIPALIEPVPSRGVSGAALLKNLSREGLLLQTRQQAGCGSWVRVTLRFHRRAALTLTGTVRWNRQSREASWEAGVQFGQMLDADLITAIVAEEASGGQKPPHSRV